MHSLSLYAQISSSRHVQALNILAGISGTQPREIYTHTLVFAPQRSTTDANTISKKNPGVDKQHPASTQLSYIHLEAPVPREAFGSTTVASGEQEFHAITQETPEPETKNLVLRRVVTEPLPFKLEEAKAKFGDGGKYKFVTEYVQEGHEMVHNDVILRLRRVLCFAPSTGASGLERGSLPALSDLVLLDTSGGWVLEATVRVEDRSKPALVRAGSEQLLALRSELRGAIELRVPERLSMDTRVKT